MSEVQRNDEYMMELAKLPRKADSIICLCQWTVVAWNTFNGEIVYQEHNKNVITTLGKSTMLSLLFGLTLGSSCVALAAGSGSTAANSADTRLATELIGNATRKAIGGITSTSSSFVPLANGDIVSDVEVISGITYEQSLSCLGIFPATDGNDGSAFREFALMDTLVLPGSPTGTSGHPYNHYVLGADVNKTTGIEIDVTTKILF